MSERKELAKRLRDTALEADGPDARDIIRAADLLDPPATGRTKRVRIPVAMTTNGRFCATAHSDDDHVKSRADAEEGVWCNGDPDPLHVVWIEATVPLPEEPTIEGEVQP